MRILIVEDDRALSDLIGRYLRDEYHFDAVYTFEQAEDYLKAYHYDVVILDRDLEGEDVGLGLIDRIKGKRQDTGVLVVSSFSSTDDKIDGLNSGADDYLDKPFDMEELGARINALTRRFSKKELLIGSMRFDLQNRTLHEGEEEVVFSKKESAILFYLLSRRGSIVSRQELQDAVYDNPENIASNTLDVTITNIRKKLPENIITTIKTRGFKIDD